MGQSATAGFLGEVLQRWGNRVPNGRTPWDAKAFQGRCSWMAAYGNSSDNREQRARPQPSNKIIAQFPMDGKSEGGQKAWKAKEQT